MAPSVQDLFIPRFKVIANDTSDNWKVGDILLLDQFDGREHLKYKERFIMLDHGVYHESFFNRYPHLFKKLEWHEERSASEMTGLYVKTIKERNGYDAVYKIEKWDFPYVFLEGEQYEMYVKHLVPATETEYNDYLQSLKQKQ